MPVCRSAPLDAAARAGRRGRMTRRCGRSCGGSPASGRGGGIARRISICSRRAGASIASGCSGCGARKGCGCRRSAASASGAGNRRCAGDRLRAERPDHVWAFDFQFDVTDDGRAVKLLYVVDEFTREALAMEAERRIDGDRVVDVLEGIVAERGRHPEFVRCDNGPEMTSNALETGAGSAGPARRSSSPAARGRTRSSRASTAASATSCSPSRCSAAWPRRR